MKILQISHYAGSIYHGMAYRPYYISRELVKRGHEVYIVAASFSHVRQINPTMSADIQHETIDGVHYVWIKTPAYKGNGTGRILNMLCFIRKLYKYLPQITYTFVPDAVIASSTYPLDAYPARWIAKKHNAKFVFELHDLWPMTPQLLGHMSKWHPFIMVMQRAEDYWCRNSDVVISLLPDAYKHLVTRGMTMDKYYVVPNGVDISEWGDETPLPQEHELCLDSLHKQGKFIVGYAGGHTVSYGLDTILDLAANVISNQQIHFVLVGKGADKDRLVKRAKELKLTNVTFLTPVPKLCVPALLKKMDVLISTSANTPLTEFGMSLNKIFDYMMSGRPILWYTKASNDIVSEANCGFTVHLGNMDVLESRLLELSQMPAKTLCEIGERGRPYIMAHYTYPKLAEKFIEALQ